MLPGKDHRLQRAGRENVGRRRFLASAAAFSFTIVKPSSIRGSQANSRIRLGMIGCGMRGKWIAPLFVKHGGFQFVGAADYFQDRADRFGEMFDIDSKRCYATLSGYKRLLDLRPDALAIESPPYFHPEQAAAAVDAGIHVNLAKPVAVDVPGCRMVEEAGRRAASKNLVFLADFQTRVNTFYQEAVQRVHRGDIGPIGLGEACFNGGDVWNSWNPVEHFLEESPNDPEARLKAWGLDRALSGDIIVEQSIHTIDVATWILDAAPVSATGSGSRKHYQHGDAWDTFAVLYRFPNAVDVLFNAKQFGKGYSDIGCRMYGMAGTIDTHYGGEVVIRGNNPYPGGNTGKLYPEGTSANIALFHQCITASQFANKTVAPSVRSNLASILGRVAAVKQRDVTWNEMMNANEKLESNVVKQLKV